MVSTLLSAAALAVPFMADALVVFGVVVMTLEVYGVVRMPHTYLGSTLRARWSFSGDIAAFGLGAPVEQGALSCGLS